MSESLRIRGDSESVDSNPPCRRITGLAQPQPVSVSMGALEIDRFAIAAELFPDQPPAFPLEDFDLGAVHLPPDDDMGVPSEDDEENEADVQTDTGFGSVLGRWRAEAAESREGSRVWLGP